MHTLHALKCLVPLFVFCVIPLSIGAKDFTITHKQTVNIRIDTVGNQLMGTAFNLLKQDMQAVLDAHMQICDNASMEVIVDRNHPDFKGKNQAFTLYVTPNGNLSIIGSDSHGATYGIIELSRMLGVSPWEWWADATPEKIDKFRIPAGFKTVKSPSVEFRGIFINDEDWGLLPWSNHTYDPGNKPGHIGPKTNSRIFELMLRLRANYYWPAMHECTHPFFLTEGNREAALKFGIYIGGSHCEPMASSTAVEWKLRGKGDYDYKNNSEEVHRFWENRVKEVARQPIIYTIGMRGVHDGAMNGAKDVEEQKNVLTQVIHDQRELIRRHVDRNVTMTPQVFIPYKEVLDVYNSGLEVPEDVCLMWCDDNYGYIRHFPTDTERKRKGGNGIYYHVSYWGRPHDYIWLGTFSPYLLYQQMKTAYDKDIRRMWMLNVGDIKPAEYQIELFMDMAWDINTVAEKGVDKHLEEFLSREFGNTFSEEIASIMHEHYRLAFIRKPEFMGNTREEEYNNPAWRIVKDMPWSESHIDQRLKQYDKLSEETERIFSLIPQNRIDTYFQLVKYPVQAATQMNAKMLYAQKARHGLADRALSKTAYDSIVALTNQYNQGFNNGGKWEGMMDHKPRKLPVFEPVDIPDNYKITMPADPEPIAIINGDEISGEGLFIHHGLGYNGKAAEMTAGENYAIKMPDLENDSVSLTLCFLPTHPINGSTQRIELTTESNNRITVDFTTHGRSEEWKENVLWNRATRRIRIPIQSSPIILKALDEGIIIDQIIIQR